MAIKDKKVSEVYANRDIASLSDRPNEDGITGAQLKARFDQLGKEVIPNYNDLIDELDDVVLPLKSDKANTYTKIESDNLLLAKVDKVTGKSLIANTAITDLTGGLDSVLHKHDTMYYTKGEITDKITIKSVTTNTLPAGQSANVTITEEVGGLAYVLDIPQGIKGDTPAKADLGLENVDNTSDVNKPVSSAQQTALNEKQAALVSGSNIKTINGATVLGSGDIVVSGGGSLETGADKIIFGQEYASHFHKKVMTSDTKSGMDALLGAKLKVIFSGDSTTAGDSTTTGFKIDELLKTYTLSDGFPYITTVNQGHSGASTDTWDSTYVTQDIALSPNVYVVRWGLNDATRGVSAFEASLRSGMTKVRASLPLANCTVVLMTPNSTNDTPNLRDATWHKAINGVIRQVARDFQCVFIDTYQLLIDSINGGDYMDNPYADGRHIHPLNVMNLWITDAIYKVLFPESIRIKYRISNLTNVNSTDVVKSASDLPLTYPVGMSMYRCIDGSRDGALITFRTSDNIFYQINMAYNSTSGAMSYRFAHTANNAWTPWVVGTITTTPETALTLSNSWEAYNTSTHENPVYYIDNDGYINIRGLIRSGTMTPGTVFATLPVGFRPTTAIFRSCLCSGGFAGISINSDGTCVMNVCPANAWFSIGVEKFK